MQVRANPNGTIGGCGCGRSRTGTCDGSHSLTEAQWLALKAKYETDEFLNDKNRGSDQDDV